MSHGGGGALVTGCTGGGVLQHRGRRQWSDTAKRRGKGGGPAQRGWQMVAAMAESGGVSRLLVTVGAQEASREGRWRR
jgi:hypothetical protein